MNDTALNYWADRLKILIYNKEKQFICPFLIEETDEFEWFQQKHIQTIIMEVIAQEFDIFKFHKEKTILTHFPLHNFMKRS